MTVPDRRSDATTAMAPSDWSIERATQYYNVSGWGAGFFSVNEKGHVVVHPMGQPGPMIDLMDVVEDIQERKIGFPCVVRFQDVLRARVKQINEAFGKAVAEMSYGGRYFGVYPIKVNQMREVVEEILDAGAPYHYGLEAGSKGELLVVLGMQRRPRGAHHLQRLQGRGVPPPRPPRAQARPQGHRRHREAVRAARTSSACRTRWAWSR